MAAFVWGDGGAQMTPETIAAQRKVAQAMMARGGDYSPIASPWQGVARVAEGLLGGYEAGQADAAEKRNAAAERELLASLIAGSGATTPAVSAPAAAPVMPTPSKPAVTPAAPVARVDPAQVTGPSPGGPVMPTAKVWGDAEAESAGLYEPSTKPVKVASLSPVAPVEPPVTPAPASSPAVATVAAAAPSGVNPRLLTAMASPYISEGTKKVLGVMLQSQLSGAKTETVDLGNKVAIMDQRGNVIREISKGEPNKGPEYGVIGKDEFGTEQYGWRDPRTQSVTPYKAQPATPAQPSTIPPAPAGVDPKVWREGQSKRATEEGMPASFDDTTKMRHEVAQLPSYKNISQAAPIYRSMVDAAGRNTKAADLNLVYGLGKIMDPTSVVREGELQMANNAQGWQEKLNGLIAQINGQGGLTPEGRQSLMAEAHSRIQSYKMMYDQDAERYRGIAKRNRANPEDIIHDFGEFKQWTAPKATVPVTIDGYTIKAK